MKSKIDGAPSFAHIHVDLEPGESIIAEPDAMASMDAEIEMKTRFNGGFFKGLMKKFFGGESLFINEFSNPTNSPKRITLVQATPGDIREIELNNNSYCFQPGAFIAATPGVNLGVRWAGFASLIQREGLFKLEVSGTGKMFYGAYGGIVEKEVQGEYIVDSGHLVGYEPHMTLKLKLSGGWISSFTSGEGIVTKVIGNGKIQIQTRSLEGLASWVNPHLF
ncbi:MAG: TIGR00266 family protein [Leptospiraceae bacterium]|nr:TIGR00266 family protein [Leptospiraceae bacterium]MCP5513551.1 TIGR00266 family protein [Leptospiraceae bacterium]